jgi:hypothetical protein
VKIDSFFVERKRRNARPHGDPRFAGLVTKMGFLQ